MSNEVRTLEVSELLERLEDEPDNEELQASRDEIEALDKDITLVCEYDFTEYAKELASDLGFMVNSENRWPYDHIDWKSAAEELKMDYSNIEIEGVEYLYQES